MIAKNRILAMLGLIAFAATAASQPLQIQFAEKVQIAAAVGQTHFDAYGRRFSLELESNERLLAKLPAQNKAALTRYHLLRGRITGQDDSWVRLTEFNAHVEGVMWDGHDLYAVTAYEKIAPHLTNALAGKAGDTVVFRLSDSSNILPAAFCALERSADGLAPDNSLVQYRKMVADLRMNAVAAATMSRQIEIALIGDTALQTRVVDATAEMLTSFNTVDGIFSEQLGLLILPTVVMSVPPGADPFISTAPSTLLGQLSTYRQNTPAIAALGIAHLITGKDLDADIVGIARLSGACSSADGVSLSEGWRGSFSTGLIMAHELGHNLGADHDGEPGACPAVAQDFIMAPEFNFSATFSQCSLDTIRPFIQSASCIKPAQYAHVEMPEAGTPIRVENDNPVVVPFVVNSTGTQAAQGVKINIAVPASFSVTSIAPAGICTASAGALLCDLGAIPAGQSRPVSVTFLPSMEGGFTLDATVSATNNQNTRDGSQHQQVFVSPNADASVEVALSASTVLYGDPVEVTITVRSLKSRAAKDVRVGLQRYGLQVISATVPGGTCSDSSGQTFCLLGDVAAGTTRQIKVQATASIVGNNNGSVYLVSPNDSVNTNNDATYTLRVNSVRDVGVDEVTPNSFAQFGMPYEFKANVHSNGIQPINGVRVDIWFYFQTSGLNAVQSVTLGGTACTKLQINNYQCNMASMAPGEIRQVSVKGTATELGPFGFNVHTYSPDQDNTNNDNLDRQLNVRYGVDASVTVSNFLSGIESIEQSGGVALWSNGLQPTTNAVMIVEMPAQLRFTRFYVNSPATTSCTLVDAQHLRCVFNVPPQSSYQDVTYYLIGDLAGSYQGKATITLAGDEDPTNNVVTWPIGVAPILDVGVRDVTVPPYVIGGHDVVVPMMVFTGSRPVPGAVALISTQVAAQIAAVTTTVGTCMRLDPQRFSCALGDLPGNSTVDLTASVSAGLLTGIGVLSVSVTAPQDNNGNNDTRSATFNTAQPGDLRVSVAATSATGTAGTAFTLPTVSLRHSGQIIQGKIEFTLPAGTIIESMGQVVLPCSGTTTMSCDLGYWDESQALQIDLRLRAAAATTASVRVRVLALNDSDDSNNEATIAVSVNAAATTPPAAPPSGGGGSSGGGGGGRFEWLALAFLALLSANRAWRVRLQPRVMLRG